jgi:hypothetical protein
MSSLIKDLENIKLTVDLVQGALNHLEFLNDVNTSRSIIMQPHMLTKAVYRYEHLWLPFYSRLNKNNQLTPPLDIEFVWHAHMLNPTEYYAYCMRVYGKLLTHQNLSRTKRNRQRESTQLEWNQLYPHISFDYLDDKSIDENTFSIFKSNITYDLIAACNRQATFLYQVSLPHYKNVYFLKLSLKRYKKFLYLSKLNPSAFLVPSYAIDLLWHTHHRQPQAYVNDTLKLMGRIMSHDDSVNDRTVGSKLNTSYDVTCDLWKKFYNEDFFFPGGMYRGGSGPIVCMGLKNEVNLENETFSVRFLSYNKNELTLELKDKFLVKCNFFQAIQTWNNIRLYETNTNDSIVAHSRLINLNELPNREAAPDVITNLIVKHERAMLLTNGVDGEFAIVKGKFKSNKFSIKYISLLDNLIKAEFQLESSQTHIKFTLDDANVTIDLKDGFIYISQLEGKVKKINIPSILAFVISFICLYLPTIDEESNQNDFALIKMFNSKSV